MARLHTNLKSVAPLSVRDAVRRVMTGAFGCEVSSPMEDFDAFTFEDGGSFGFYFVADDDKVLSPEQHREIGTWVEIDADDLDATEAALGEHGVERFEYFDQAHRYFQLPGGQVFRLKAR